MAHSSSSYYSSNDFTKFNGSYEQNDPSIVVDGEHVPSVVSNPNNGNMQSNNDTNTNTTHPHTAPSANTSSNGGRVIREVTSTTYRPTNSSNNNDNRPGDAASHSPWNKRNSMCQYYHEYPELMKMKQNRRRRTVLFGVVGGVTGLVVFGPILGVVGGLAGAYGTKVVSKRRERSRLQSFLTSPSSETRVATNAPVVEQQVTVPTEMRHEPEYPIHRATAL